MTRILVCTTLGGTTPFRRSSADMMRRRPGSIVLAQTLGSNLRRRSVTDAFTRFDATTSRPEMRGDRDAMNARADGVGKSRMQSSASPTRRHLAPTTRKLGARTAVWLAIVARHGLAAEPVVDGGT